MLPTTIVSVIAAACDRDPEEGALLESIFRNHYKKMLGIAYSVTGNTADAEDAVSVAFEYIWNHISYFMGRDDDDVKRLLTTYVKNAALNVIRSRRAKKNDTVSFDSEEFREQEFRVSDKESLEDLVIRREQLSRVLECLDKLPDTDRQIILLKYRYGYSSKAISEVMGLSITAVDNRLSRARAKLRVMLEED